MGERTRKKVYEYSLVFLIQNVHFVEAVQVKEENRVHKLYWYKMAETVIGETTMGEQK